MTVSTESCKVTLRKFAAVVRKVAPCLNPEAHQKLQWPARHVTAKFVAALVQIGYVARMSMILRQIARYVAQRAASEPEANEKAFTAAQVVADEAKHIAKEDDRDHATGRTARRAFDRLLSGR